MSANVLRSFAAAACLAAVANANAADAAPFGTLADDALVRRAPALPPPAHLRAYTDPVFGTTVTRITDIGQVPNVQRIRHYYSKANPFNADDSRAVFFTSDGAALLYDTATWKPLTALKLRSSDPEIQWDPVDPNTFYYLDFAGNSPDVRAMFRYDLRSDRGTLLRDFAEYDAARGLREGNFDAHGRYYAMVGGKGARLEAFVYDVRADKVLRRLPVTLAMVDDWVSVTPSGKYVVMMGKDRSRVFDIDLNHLRDLPKGSFGHADLCLRTDGTDVMVYDGADHQLDDNRNINMADLTTGQVSRLVRIGWGTTPHVSCRNLDLPGWALISTQGPDPKYPNRDFEVFWVKLDGSGEVRRVAHHHSDREKGGYFAEQHAVPNRRGTKILFASNWDGLAPIADYLVELPNRPSHAAGKK
jgi:hypothetical protein